MSQDTQFLSVALALVRNGYRVIPIKPGEKRPGLDEWQNLVATPDMVRKWARQGFANGNIGILTTQNPAIDLDIYDKPMAEKLEAWCLSEFGDTPVRIGQAPKRLLMYYATKPFAKMYTDYVDPSGKKHRVEVLGHGQQFVAYGTHPTTRQPFRWMSMDEPLDTPADMVQELTPDMARAVLAKYREFAEKAGWKIKQSTESRAASMVVPGDDADDALLTHKSTLKISKDEVVEALSYVDNADDYDRWIMVGMALHHQSHGKPGGLDVWKDWSSQAPNYDEKACDHKWASFNEQTRSRTPVTFASVLKIAKAREKEVKAEEFNRALNMLRTATSEEDIFGPLAVKLANAITAEYQVDIVAKRMQDRVLELTDVKPRIETVRKALLQAKATPKTDKDGKVRRPEWCDGWVYLKNGDRFYHLDSKSELTERGFNAVYDRLVLSDEDRMLGVALPDSRAASMALNLYNLPAVDNTVYLPGFDKLVTLNGKLCANTFDETSVPQERAPSTPDEHRAIELMVRHFNTLFDDDIEREMVLDYLAYNVQHPSEKIVWALVMQGAEGGGKTLLMKLLARVLGPQNVGPVSATELHDKYTGWAEGRKMVFIEEIRLHGANRYEILDKMKPYVSNEEVTIRRMNRDSYEIPNVTNYVMFTNYWDAMPFSRMDRRYYVVATTFQTKEQLTEFNAANPDYFANLYGAVQDHGEVLRWWLMQHQFSSRFQPKRPAIDSNAKLLMRDQSESNDDADTLQDALEASDDPEVSDVLLNADKLRDVVDVMGGSLPYGRALSGTLTRAGFHLIGRHRVDPTDKPARFYTRHPHLFKKGEELDTIRELRNPKSMKAPPHPDDIGDPFA